jgi:peptidoglycan/xylan/chitin deacetylase (PgdA/CDA1 family)
MSHKKKAKKNNQLEIAKLLGLKGINNTTLAVLLGFILMAVGVFGAHYLSPKTTNWLTYPGKMFMSALGGKPGEPTPLAHEKLTSIKVPILMYHHVGDAPEGADSMRISLTIPTSEFEIQVAWLKGQGYESITLNDLLRYTKSQKLLPEKPVIFTFDDGYLDVFENAVPVLQKYGFVGSFAIITQFTGRSYGTNAYAPWQKIKEAQKLGMEIISHTQDHFDGTSEKYDATFILRNLKDSQTDLLTNLGAKSPPILIYPYGHYDGEYLKLAQEAGYEMALTVEQGKTIYLDRLMEIPRIRVSRNENIEIFKRLIQN